MVDKQNSLKITTHSGELKSLVLPIILLQKEDGRKRRGEDKIKRESKDFWKHFQHLTPPHPPL